ncbi:hypothetical protein [Clostridium sp. 1001271B_151109_B4]|uniref:hypothetical protein n=1 Tax=Clostridium sp. 1001271B_151109_B4 TaxID=2787148 RepID=UPI0018AB9226|nr:hypothetical protein [Clostridium sp. 1001271B_151109_B4]
MYASKTKLKRKELTQIKFEVDITEKYKFIYNYYKKYIDSIIDIEEKVSFIEEQKLYAENSFGSFRGSGINNILSIDGALLIGLMATIIAEFIKFSVSEICRAVLNKEYFISNEWDFITASGIFICIILFRMGRNSKSEKEDDIFNGLCIRALEKIESEITK